MPRASEYLRYRRVILRVIEWHLEEMRESPSLTEIANKTGISVATARKYVKFLNEEGLIEWWSRRHRSIELTNMGRETLKSWSPKVSPR